MTQADKLVLWAEQQLGTAEDPLGSNNIRYNTAYWGKVVTGDSYPWCMAWVWCGFQETGLSHLFYSGRKTARCTVLMNWAKEKGYFVTEAFQKGDIFFYDWDGKKADAEHTGIYTGAREGQSYVVIEGNTNDAVSRILRKPSSILGAFRPQWEEEAELPDPPVEPVAVYLREIRKGDSGEQVKAMQALLIGRGYSCGRDGADGEYGVNTQLGLLRFQNDAGLQKDGICGQNTWTRLLKG